MRRRSGYTSRESTARGGCGLEIAIRMIYAARVDTQFARRWFSTARLLIVLALLVLVGCGDDHSHVRVTAGEGTIPEPGTFHGTTSLGGQISIRVGSIDQILLECGNTPILAVFSPPERVHDDGTFGGGIFTAQDAGHGRINDDDHQCDATFEVTRGPVATEGPPSFQ